MSKVQDFGNFVLESMHTHESMKESEQFFLSEMIAKPERTKSQHYENIYGPQREKTCLRGFANNKGADQPAHPREQQRRRPACASAQSDQHLYYSLTGECHIYKLVVSEI